MDIVYLRSQLIASKDFLSKIFIGKPRQNCKAISLADEKKLNILIKILHLVCNGHIKIRKEHFEVIARSRRLGLLKSKFERKASYVCVLRSSIIEKQQVLKQFCSLYPLLLHFLFFLD